MELRVFGSRRFRVGGWRLGWARAMMVAVCCAAAAGWARAESTPRLRLAVEDGRLMADYELPAGTLGTVLRSSTVSSAAWEPAALAGVHASSGRIELPATDGQAYFRVAIVQRPVLSDMVWVKPGRFVMGSEEDEFERLVDEGPAHEVTIPLGFWMGRCEVTAGDYAPRMGLPAPAVEVARRAVCYVSWQEAMLYCAELNRLQSGSLPVGYAYRLPTEAEWEYAARAGTSTRYSFGSGYYAAEVSEYAWWAGNANRIMDVGTKRPNPWGLHDMHGNVFEWCMDLYAPYPGGVMFEGSPPHHISRGGSNYCPGRYVRSASRHHFSADRYPLIGFRIVLAPRMEQAEAVTIPSPRR